MAQVQSAVISIAANLATGSVTGTKILDATVASADLDPTTIQYAAVSIAAAAVATLRGTPVQLVAAPGSGLILEFISATLLLDWVTPGFTETDDNLAVKYENGSGAAASETIECTGFIDQVADTITIGVAKNDVIVAGASAANKALVLHNTGNGEFAGSGGSAVRVKTAYRVHTSGF